MSAYEVTRRACECIDSGKYDFMVLNFANTDMVGHTGVFEAAVKAVETVDVCVGTLVDHIIKTAELVSSLPITAIVSRCSMKR